MTRVAKVPEISQTMSGPPRKRPCGEGEIFKCDLCLRDNFRTNGGLNLHRTRKHPNAPKVQQQNQQHKRRRSGEGEDTQQNAAESTSVIAHDELEVDSDSGEARDTVEQIAMEEEEDAGQDVGAPSNDQQAEEDVDRADGSNRIEWGEYEGVEAIREVLEAAHLKITTWQKNTFDLPMNAVGKGGFYGGVQTFKAFQHKDVMGTISYQLIYHIPSTDATETSSQVKKQRSHTVSQEKT